MRLKIGLAAMVGGAALAGCNESAVKGSNAAMPVESAVQRSNAGTPVGSAGEVSNAGAPVVAGPSMFADSCERLEGVWRRGNRLYRIRKDGSVYSISGHGDSFAGPCTDGMFSTGTLVGNVTYLQSVDQMIFAGGQYSRSSEEEEARRIADLQAAEMARQQARVAEAEVEQQRYAEKRRLESIRIHLVNCWNNGVQCDDFAADARVSPGDVQNAKQEFFSRHDITSDRIAERERRLGPLPGSR